MKTLEKNDYQYLVCGWKWKIIINGKECNKEHNFA